MCSWLESIETCFSKPRPGRIAKPRINWKDFFLLSTAVFNFVLVRVCVRQK